MPELPDVEVFRRYLDSTALHKRIDRVEVKRNAILETTPQKLGANLTGHTLAETQRHGKYLFARAENGQQAAWLVLHFGMTGRLAYFKAPDQEPEHDRLLFHLANGYKLAYDCQRLLGEIDIVESPDQLIAEKDLGPDALALSVDDFTQLLADRRGAIKTRLMNQSILAGIGNVYSDEILFQARLHPKTPANDLPPETFKKLYGALRDVLQTAIDCQADPGELPDSYLIPHREPGGKCPACGGEVEQITISGRNAYYCPECQQKP